MQALEVDTDEAWHDRRESVEQLVERITISRTEDGRAKIHIAYKFAPPVHAASGITDHKTFVTPPDTPALMLVATVVK
jgi:hypothetical protein